MLPSPLTTVPPPRSDNGLYVTLDKTDDGNLRISLTDQGRVEADAIRVERDRHGIRSALLTFLEDHLASGWEIVPPEDLGALTAAPILSDEIERHDQGEIIRAGRVYWYPDYAVRDEIEELLAQGVVVFTGAE